MKIKNLKLLVFSIGICELAGIIGSIFTFSSVKTWYLTLNKPSFNPPSSIFGPVWTILYLLMGVSLYLILLKLKKNKSVKYAVKTFFIHLVFNSLWSIVFFGFHNLSLSLVIIVILLGLIIYLIKLFEKIDKNASMLLLPYVAWVAFATVLNFTIWSLN